MDNERNSIVENDKNSINEESKKGQGTGTVVEKKKRGNFIFRQELKNKTPECNACCAIICHSVLLVIFAGIGILIISTGNSVNQVSIDYTSWFFFQIATMQPLLLTVLYTAALNLKSKKK